jgi:hypothetical protein
LTAQQHKSKAKGKGHFSSLTFCLSKNYTSHIPSALTFSVSLNEDVFMAVEIPKTSRAARRAALARLKQERSGKDRRKVDILEYKTLDARLNDQLDEGNAVAMIDRALQNIDLVRQRMANAQIEIDRLRTETRLMIAELLT